MPLRSEECVSMFQDVVSGCCLTDLCWHMTDKESANCRLEANYAHQQELDMIPLMMTVRTIQRLFTGISASDVRLL